MPVSSDAWDSEKRLFLARWTIGEASAEDLRRFAERALEVGEEAREFVDLAVSGDELNREELARLLARALASTGELIPSAAEAACRLAVWTIREIVTGQVPPLEGAMRVDALGRFGLPQEYLIFSGRLDEYGYLIDQRQEILDRIVQEARLLSRKVARPVP